jgi:hypothetical protein
LNFIKLNIVAFVTVVIASTTFDLQAKQYYKKDGILCSAHHSPGTVEMDICEGRSSAKANAGSKREVSKSDQKKIAGRLKKCLKNNKHIEAGVTATLIAYAEGMEPEEAMQCGVLVSSAYEAYTSKKDWFSLLPNLHGFYVQQGVYSVCVNTEGGDIDTTLCNPATFLKAIEDAQNSLKSFIPQCRALTKRLKLPSIKKC